MDFDIKKLSAKPGTKIDLESFDTSYTGNYNKKSAKNALKENTKELREVQEMFYADDRYSLLIVLQASDAAGKDGAIRHVFGGINPQGCRVHSFKSPSKNELEHNAQFGGYGFKKICNRCADYIDKQQDIQQGN